MPQSESINELATALAKAQAQMKVAPFNKVNPHFRNKYADLTAVIDAVRKPLNDNGIAFTQMTENHAGAICLVTRLLHSSGQWMAGEYPLPTNVSPQQLGSALTYAKRYSLAAMAGISSDEDDDAEGARKDGQTATAIKRDNPHVTKPEDLSDAKPRYDTRGERVDWINTAIFPDTQRMPKAKARDIAGNLRKEMLSITDLNDLLGWADSKAELVAALPADWEEILQNQYQEHLDALRGARKAAE